MISGILYCPQINCIAIAQKLIQNQFIDTTVKIIIIKKIHKIYIQIFVLFHSGYCAIYAWYPQYNILCVLRVTSGTFIALRFIVKAILASHASSFKRFCSEFSDLILSISRLLLLHCDRKTTNRQTEGILELFMRLKNIKERKNHNSFNFLSNKHDKMVETINVRTAGFQMSLWQFHMKIIWA